MRKILYILIAFVLSSLTWVACSKKEPWNESHETPKTVLEGKVLNREDLSPIKGIKLLIGRMTSADGVFTDVDTVSSGVDGSFSLPTTFPNKFRVVIRDTLRYTADTVYIEVKDNEQPNLELKTIPRFGAAPINVSVSNEATEGPYGNVKVALFVRESGNEEFSAVDTLVSDAQGRVSFEGVAFPVYYKVELAEHPLAYQGAFKEGKLVTKDPLELKLKTSALFDTGDINLKAKYYYTNEVAANTPIKVSLKSVFEDEFTNYDLALDENGLLTVPNVNYPAVMKIEPQSGISYPFGAIEITISSENAESPIELNLFDVLPRFANMTPPDNYGDNTLVAFYGGVKVRTMEVDSKGNIYAVTENSELIRIAVDGSSHKVLATGFAVPWGIALQNDSTFYVVENTGGHTIKKVVLNRMTDAVEVSVLTGKPNTTGTTDGTFAQALFNRPGDAVYDSKRNVLWVSEWSNARIRKVDLNTGMVSTATTLTGFGFGISLSEDKNTLYVGSHTNQPAIYKYNIEENKTYVVRNGNSPRHVAVAPNGDVYFTLNQYARVYKFTQEDAAEVILDQDGKPINPTSSSKTSIIAGRQSGGMFGTLPTVNPKFDIENTDIFLEGKSTDSSPTGLVYDAYKGRLYFAVPSDGRVYYLRSKSIPAN